MALPHQTVSLLETAHRLVHELPADAILFLTETNLDWDEVLSHLEGCRLLVAAQDGLTLPDELRSHPELNVCRWPSWKRSAAST
jgi:hypothetical protein